MFLYISCIFGIIFTSLENNINIFIFLILAYGVAFNFDVHKRFQNYVSLCFSFIWSFFLTYFLFFRYFYTWTHKEIVFVSIFLLIAFWVIVYTYMKPMKHIQDYYFFHIFSYLINIFWVISFFVLVDFHILYLWIILLLESIFIFMSYYKLNSLKTLPDA